MAVGSIARGVVTGVATLGLLASLAGCRGTTSSVGPPAGDGIRDFIAALRSDDPSPAYSLLTDDTRVSVPFDEFAVLWKQSARERKHRAHNLEEGLKGNPDLGESAKVTYADGQSVNLLREAGAWKLESALVSRYHAGRPHDAVRIFADGLAARNYDGIMRVLTRRRRKVISKQVDEFATTLIKHLNDEITFVGKDKAELRWEEGDKRYRIVLHKDGDEWRIDDIDERAAPAKKKAAGETPD
jgi:hypothetical protein